MKMEWEEERENWSLLSKKAIDHLRMINRKRKKKEPLSIYEERDYIQIKELLLFAYEPVIFKVQSIYFVFIEEKDDLFQAGYLGLMKAIDQFDGSASFSTYLLGMVRREMERFVARSSYALRLPAKLIQVYRELDEIQSGMEENDWNQLMEAYNRQHRSEDHLQMADLVSWYQYREMSSFETLTEENDHISWETISDNKKAFDRELYLLVHRYMKEAVTARQYDVLCSIYGVTEEKSLAQLAREQHVTREMMRQEKERALQKVRNRLLSSKDHLVIKDYMRDKVFMKRSF